MLYVLFMLEQREESEKENGKRGLSIALSFREQDARYDHMKYEEEYQRIFNAAGEMQQDGQQNQVGAYLQVNYSLYRPERQLFVSFDDMIEQHANGNIVREEQGCHGVKSGVAQGNIEKIAGHIGTNGNADDLSLASQ
jgi:hypothetical protein